jgi:hypothetical protein
MDLVTIQKHLADREWRLNNLYYIKDEKAQKVLFRMNPVQKELHDNLWFFNIVPKARQLGITTFFTILYLDQVLFGENKTATIIAHTESDMKKIFRTKIKFAWDNMHPWIKEYIGSPNTNTANEMTFPNGGVISVALSSRSDTVQMLHISEFGKICRKYPEKAEEIVTGAINSVHAGQMVSIESTAEGREGYFYEFCMDAEKRRLQGTPLTELDFKIFFFPWFVDKRYTLEEASFAIPQELQEYFKTLKEKHGIELTLGQQRWYAKKKELNRDKQFAEFPSTLDEAFSISTEGAYYNKEMSRVYLENRIGPYPVRDGVPVDTWWDLGMNDYNVIIFTQTVGPSIFIVDLYYNHGYKLGHYVDIMKDKKYSYGRHFLPHDVEVRDMSSGRTRKHTLYELGLSNIVVSKKLPRADGIEQVRGKFSRFYFDEVRCKKLVEALGNYRKAYDTRLGMFKDSPLHDENSHFADAVRNGVVSWSEEMIFSNSEQKEEWDKQTDQSFFN